MSPREFFLLPHLRLLLTGRFDPTGSTYDSTYLKLKKLSGTLRQKRFPSFSREEVLEVVWKGT